MSVSFDLEAPDHFTAGAVGRPGQRVFYLQGREAGAVVTLKVDKEHVRALGEHLAGLLARLPAGRPGAPAAPSDAALLEPLEPAWAVGSLALGYDAESDRIVVVATETVEEDEEAAAADADQPAPDAPEAATARFRITRPQATALVERARALMQAGRPICPMCSQPKDPAGHVCPRSNGHVVH